MERLEGLCPEKVLASARLFNRFVGKEGKKIADYVDFSVRCAEEGKCVFESKHMNFYQYKFQGLNIRNDA